jgi:hypothetical protein
MELTTLTFANTLGALKNKSNVVNMNEATKQFGKDGIALLVFAMTALLEITSAR